MILKVLAHPRKAYSGTKVLINFRGFLQDLQDISQKVYWLCGLFGNAHLNGIIPDSQIKLANNFSILTVH